MPEIFLYETPKGAPREILKAFLGRNFWKSSEAIYEGICHKVLRNLQVIFRGSFRNPKRKLEKKFPKGFLVKFLMKLLEDFFFKYFQNNT